MGRKENSNKGVRKVFLDNLPRWESGTYKGKINWKESIGYKVGFIYDNIEGEIVIIDYTLTTQYLYIKYLNTIKLKIKTINLMKCKLGKLLGKKTSDFKIKIGQTFKDDKRDLIITGMEYRKDKRGQNKRYYRYTCNNCGWTECWIEEFNLLQQNQGCSCCCTSPQTVIQGINDIPTTAPWMIKYFQGGYDEAKLYTKSSSKRIYPICPDCGRIKDKSIAIYGICSTGSIGCNCSDKTPYPEKFMFGVLEQLILDFKTQLNKTQFKWINKYKYDFYFKYNNEDYIIETNGIQHYEQTSRKGARALIEEQSNDKYKKQLALANGVKEENYIVIDCRYSKLDYIKQNILDSRLGEVFDLNNIDWNKVEEFSLSNRVKEACGLWNNGIKSTKEIGEIMKLNKGTIVIYLHKGNELGWCKYNRNMTTKKPIDVFKEGKYLKSFESITKCASMSEKIFGIKFDKNYIHIVIKKKNKSYKGYTFKYSEHSFTNDLTIS